MGSWERAGGGPCGEAPLSIEGVPRPAHNERVGAASPAFSWPWPRGRALSSLLPFVSSRTCGGRLSWIVGARTRADRSASTRGWSVSRVVTGPRARR